MSFLYTMSESLIDVIKSGDEDAETQMRLLLDAGADVNVQNKYRWTALMFAVRSGYKHGAGMVRLLINAGADANMQDNPGWTALMRAARFDSKYCTEMMYLLVDAGADVNMQNNNGCTVKDFDSTNLFDNPGTGYGFTVSDSP